MSRIQANLLLLVIALIWGSAFVAQSQGMADVGPMLFTGVRFLIGAAVVAPLAWREWKQLARQGKTPTATDARHIGGLGLLMLVGAALQQVGIISTSVTNAGFLTALYVPLVPVLSWLWLRQLPHWSVWPGALACLVGAFLLSGAHELNIGVGDLWVIASALPWAVHVLFVGRVADKLAAPFLVACGQFLVCGSLALVYSLFMEPVSLKGLIAAAGPIAYTGVLSVGVAFTAQVVAQRYAHAADAAIILSSETLFAAVFGYLMMGDRLNPAGFAGCALILGSMLVIQLLPLFRMGRHKPASVLDHPV
ncbi:DMT family transporter [Roseateles microcysteis]|uniref:DMT family transporter n=1 Tax=Roseateles microcysteis TaxID=3119057 RepID=UPI002FE62081